MKGLGLFLFGLSPKRNKNNPLCALCVFAVNPCLNNKELISKKNEKISQNVLAMLLKG
jgi:hypothetical protein